MPGMSGLGTYTLQLARELILLCEQNQHSLDLYILPGAEINFPDIPDTTDFRYVRFPVEHHLRGDWWKNIILPSNLDRNNINIFHDPAYQLPVFRSRAKYVVTIHDLSPFKFPETNTWKYNFYWKKMTRMALKRASRVITVSNYVRDEVEDMFPAVRGRIDVTTEAAAPIFSPGFPNTNSLKRLRVQGPYLMTTAKYEPRKNLARCLDAYASILSEIPDDVGLVIAGGMGWKTDEIARTLERLKLQERVVTTGYLPVDDLVSLVRGALATVVPSLYEGFGLPVLESMACGTPVICSKAASLAEVAGGAALHFDPLDTESIADAMTKIISDADLRAELSNAGIKRASEFSWRQTAKETLEVYSRVMES
ncbi:glycosyltransferase family 4 protein [bacterium]|nr:glycosyltransferase family 4 protein [bacterium]